MKKIAYLITDVEEYGKLISYCIEHDIYVFRTFWDDREKGNRCYYIDWWNHRCLYAPRQFYEDNGYEILTPKFYLDSYGRYAITKE